MRCGPAGGLRERRLSPTAFGREFTQGRANAGSVQFTSNASRKQGTTWTPEFKYTHNGPVWQV